ncbi:hypothetical protein [Geomonas anaerohicana]|uniref:Collagen triple helix repeat protein n=1 Tax=Geomonas anaerohicana TaxID=2798583 RepID=A0ABS0YGZ9_9BACT|nr:hypothetical protein [Geomonas anaerohicana]MBJ6751585.1 hypothetical protein [Geomonas anaerohicana]
MKSRKMMMVALCAVPLSVLPVVAGAETDRITVEDPATGTVKFKVTSDGNVTAGQYTGDGALLANVAHFKGAWNSALSYAKDDCVSYGGSTYIALQASSNAQPDLAPTSWTVMAQKGAAGAAGTTGATGPQGPQGPAGSPDTQTDILNKIKTQADGAVLAMKQSANDAASTVKLAVKDTSDVNLFQVAAGGNVAIGATTPTSSLTIKNKAEIAGTGVLNASNNGNTITGVGTAFKSQLHIGDTITAAGQTRVVMTIPSDTSITVNAVLSPALSSASFTYSPQSLVKLSDDVNNDKFVVTAGGNVGIGTSTPANALNVVSVAGPVAQFINTVGGSSGAGFVAGSDPGRAVLSGERLGYILLGGSKDAAHTMGNSTGIAGFASENWSSTTAGAYLQFLTTANGGTTRTEKMRVDHNGNVGVGTTSPQQKFEVAGGMRIYAATPPTKPDCSDANIDVATKVRGTFWLTQGGAGVKDSVEVCAKDAAGSYAWRTLY